MFLSDRIERLEQQEPNIYQRFKTLERRIDRLWMALTLYGVGQVLIGCAVVLSLVWG